MLSAAGCRTAKTHSHQHDMQTQDLLRSARCCICAVYCFSVLHSTADAVGCSSSRPGQPQAVQTALPCSPAAACRMNITGRCQKLGCTSAATPTASFFGNSLVGCGCCLSCGMYSDTVGCSTWRLCFGANCCALLWPVSALKLTKRVADAATWGCCVRGPVAFVGEGVVHHSGAEAAARHASGWQCCAKRA